jgi:AcrR family transcriptional regulator
MDFETPMASNAASPTTSRRQQIVNVAWSILESEGPDAVTMRRLGTELGIKAPSLYKHFPDKAAVEAAIIDRGFLLWGEQARLALALPGDRIQNLAAAYRRVVRDMPHLYRLMTVGPLDRSRLTPGLEEWSGAPFGELFHDPELARAFWGFLHGMAILEIDRRFPDSADLERSWAAGVSAFASAASPNTIVGTRNSTAA